MIKIELMNDGEVVNLTISRSDYHLIWSALHAVNTFIENRDFYALSGYSKEEAIDLCDRLGDEFDNALME